jgi:hypothetical protein
VGWVAIDEFEDLLSDLCDTKIIQAGRRANSNIISKVRNAYLGKFEVEDCDIKGELLLIVARKPSDLSVIRNLGDVKQRFRYITGYVIDSYFTEDFTADVKEFDHVFCTTEAAVETVVHLGGKSSVLRQGFDCLTWACSEDLRGIDLLGFGRQPPTYHRAFQQAFHRDTSNLLYLHSPIGAVSGIAVWQERPMMLKLMQRSKLSLAFHLLVEPQGNRPRSPDFVTSRWFESLTCGCLVVGRRPPGAMADDMLSWPGVTIDLPNNPYEAVEQIVQLASDVNCLQSVRARNVIEMSRRHDWRYRVRDIYSHFGLQLPQKLQDDLAKLQALVVKLESQKMLGG